MRLAEISLLALAGKAAHAYRDTSPFFLFSTSDLLLSTDQVQSGSRITSNLISTLSTCPSDFYFLVNQPGIGVSDFSTPDSAPTLSRFLNRENASPLRSSAVIPEVAGKIDLRSVQRELQVRCGARSTAVGGSALSSPMSIDGTTQVLSMDFSAPSESQPERVADVLDHDLSLLSVLDMLRDRNYTVIYTTTPPDNEESPEQYSMNNYDDLLHINLKRDMQPEPAKVSVSSNQTMVDGPLFEKYQFLTPGLFTALSVSLLLLIILYVAISGIASLQVSYAAFEKENGPTGTQKKAQ